MSLNLKDNPFNAIVSEVTHDSKKGDLPLSNWTVALKDNVNMKGTKTTGSSKILENYESVYNATIVDKLIDAGAKIVAKTSMDELNMGGTNRNAVSGPVENPFDPEHISGGSSGGSAALAGAGLVRLAIGSDTGDSVRKPASYCGVVGVKPTYGRISRFGLIPYASSLDHVGYFTQNVKDATKALEVLSGHDALDMTSLNEEAFVYEENTFSLEGKRIGIFKNVIDAIKNETILNAFNELIQNLEAQGAEIVVKEMNEDLAKSMLGVYLIIANGEAVTHHASLDGVRFGNAKEGASLEEIMINTRTEGFSAGVKERLIYGQYSIQRENNEKVFVNAKKVRQLLVDAYTEMMSDVDVMLAPATPSVAPRIDTPINNISSNRYLIAENYMVINNFSGTPSMTMPLGNEGHMPFGLNISAKAYEEQTMFEAAQKIEEIIDWKRGI